MYEVQLKHQGNGMFLNKIVYFLYRNNVNNKKANTIVYDILIFE